MPEEILDIRNGQKAFKPLSCRANKGAGGIDGMQTDELRDYLNANWHIKEKKILRLLVKKVIVGDDIIDIRHSRAA